VAEIAPFAFRCPKLVLFGSGRLRELGAQAARLGRRALIVTGGASARSSGALDRAADYLTAAGVECAVCDGVSPEPPLSDVERARALLRESGADLVIALGGGSAIDVGKAAAALARTDAPLADYHSGKLSCDRPGVPCIAIPTTSGTGAEVTPNSVLTDPDRGVKTSIRGEALTPEIAVVDPELTFSLPPSATAHSGLDALCQALEALVSRSANPPSDALAFRAARVAAGALLAAYRDGGNTGARERMALASHLAGLALASARLGLVHGLAHPVGAATHLPHGMVCGALLPMVIRANARHVGGKYAAVAAAIGIGEGKPDADAGLALADWVEDLCHSVAVPTRVAALGLTEADLPALAAESARAGSTAYNPLPMGADEIEELLRANL
jgi:alcohol dehydrogenase class IV